MATSPAPTDDPNDKPGYEAINLPATWTELKPLLETAAANGYVLDGIWEAQGIAIVSRGYK